MFTYDEKKHFSREPFDPCCPPPHPHHSIPEKVEITSRMLRDTLDRLLMFEKTMKDKYDDLFAIMTKDNVTFKDLMQDAYSDFVSNVRSEINLFETNTDGIVTIFKEAVNARLEEFNQNYSEAFATYKEEIAEWQDNFEESLRAEFSAYTVDVNSMVEAHVARFAAQDAKISDAVAYMKTNLNATLENLLNEMDENGSLIGVLDTTVCISVKQYGAAGDGVTDDTDAFKEAITAVGASGTLFVPNGTYLVSDAIPLVSNMVLAGAANAVIVRAENNLENYEVIAIHNVENVTVRNLTIKGERATHTGTTGEWGNVVSIKGSKNIRIEDCVCSDGWGDGVYIGTGNNGCENVSIVDCTIDNNRRNGISVVNCAGIHVKGCTISNTQGVAPQMAIDFECNNASESVTNAIIENCVFKGNKFGVGTGNGSNLYEVIVRNCSFYGNQGISIFGTSDETVGGNFLVKGCSFFTNHGVTIGAKSADGLPVQIEDCHFECNNVCIGYGDSTIDSAYEFGGIRILNCYFHKWLETTCPIRFINSNANGTYRDIVIDCHMEALGNSGVYFGMKVTGEADISIKRKNREIAVNTTINKYQVFNQLDVKCTNGDHTITLAESIPYGVPITFKFTGATATYRLAIALENGYFPQFDSVSKIYLPKLYDEVTVRHEAEGVWSVVDKTTTGIKTV